MAIRDRIGKALRLPAGSVTQSEQQIIAQVPASGVTAEAMQRTAEMGNVPFAPGIPLIPSLINPPRSDGRATPRISQFPVAWNLQIVEQRDVPFRVLREVADQADIVRKCIEVVKNAITGMKWDVSLSTDATERLMASRNMSHQEAAVEARDLHLAEISRIKDFWVMPDRINGLSFQEWVGMVLEEMLVIDAVSIYPNKTIDRTELHSLEILDGTTIKPLLNERGARPHPPHPAFQQILWGFPRGEFTYSADGTDEFTADDLVYAPRNRRPYTPYGYSSVERCLPIVDLYMKRIQWLRTEFTDGVIPDMVIMSDANYGNNPDLLRGYETVFNDSLAGNTEQRRRAKVFPAGMTPMFTAGWDTKYKSDFDEWLIKAICGHFGVLPTQIGFTPKSGLGGKGHQDGEANSAETIGLRPVIMWLTDLLNQLSYRFLDMPRDLTFTLTDGTESDQMAQAMRRKMEIEQGTMTLNEARAEMGKPLFTFPEADIPIIVAGANVIPMNTYTPLQPADQNGTAVPGQQPTDTRTGSETPNGPANQQAEEKPISDDAKKELTAFVRWSKAPKARGFEFKFISPDLAETLNTLVHEDAEAARDLASISKAGGNPKVPGGMEPLPARHPAKSKAEQLRKKYRKRLLSDGLDADALAEEWISSGSPDAKGWIENRGIGLLGAAAIAALIDLYYESAYVGTTSSVALTNQIGATPVGALTGQPTIVPTPTVAPSVNWNGWKPGDVDLARLLLSDSFVPSLVNLVAQAPALVNQLDNTRAKDLAVVLTNAIKDGLTVQETANAIRDLLANPSRAEVIANTEMNRAINLAAKDHYQMAGVVWVDWVTSGGNTCDDCLAIESASPYPLDTAPEPPEHPNCGCMLMPSGGGIELAVQPNLVKVRRNEIDKALKDLADIPDAKPGYIAVPWEIETRPKMDKTRWADSELKLVKIEKLYASQKYLKRANVEWHLNHPGETHEGQNAYPNVLQVEDDYLIYDGHHRLAALWLMGVRKTNVWFLEE